MITIKKMFVPLFTGVLISLGSTSSTAQAAENNFIQENPWESNFENINDSTLLNITEDNSSEVFYGEKAEADFERLQRESNMDKKLYEIQSKTEENEYQKLVLSQPLYTTLAETAASTKSQYRSKFKSMALLMGSLDTPLAGNYLYHSLQDKPTAKLSPAGSGTSNALSNTRFYTGISIPIAANIDVGNKNGRTSVSGTGSEATSVGNSGLDFYLTLGKISYEWAAGKQSNGTWKVVIRFHDKYNFEHIYQKRTNFPYSYVDTINNYAAKGQSTGAIVPYPVHITMEQYGYKPKK